MTSFFVVPTFVPPTLEQLVKEPDEVAIIVSQEAKITQELTEVREYNRDTEPLGFIAAQEELESEQDDGLTSDGEFTEEEDEDEDEETGEELEEEFNQGEGTDIDDDASDAM